MAEALPCALEPHLQVEATGAVAGAEGVVWVGQNAAAV